MHDNRYRDIEYAANEAAARLAEFENAWRAKESADERYEHARQSLDAAEFTLRSVVETTHIGDTEEVNVP